MKTILLPSGEYEGSNDSSTVEPGERELSLAGPVGVHRPDLGLEATLRLKMILLPSGEIEGPRSSPLAPLVSWTWPDPSWFIDQI